MTTILSNLNRLKKIFTSKFAVKWISKIPPHLANVATLPCETLMSTKQAINNKSQGSVATYLRCGGVVNNKLRKVYCWVCEWKKFKIVNIWQRYKQERDCLMHLCTWPTHCKKTEKVHETITFLLVTLPNIHRFKKFYSHSTTNLS